MSYQKQNLALVACALIITTTLSWIQHDKFTGNLLMGLFIVLAIVLVIKQLRWERRALPQPVEEPQRSEPPSPVVLVMGPYAKKWFTEENYTNSTRYSHSAAWLLIDSPEELAQRLHFIQQHTPDTPLAAFFPLLPDGHDNTELMIAQLVCWQRDFAGSLSAAEIPLTLGIYAQLSAELRKNSASNATWSGVLDFNLKKQRTLPEAIADVKEQLEQQVGSAGGIQRNVLGSALLNWLKQQKIEDALDRIIGQSNLRFTTLLLCDHGYRFTRHGAWSTWLEHQYGILPSLSHKRIIPSLPAIKLPPPARPVVVVPAPRFATQPTMLWSISLITLLLATQISTAGWHAWQQQKAYDLAVAPLVESRELSVARLQDNLARMKTLRNSWQTCTDRESLWNWGLSPCISINQHADSELAKLMSVKIITSAGIVPLFEPGKALISARAITQLEDVAQQIARVPDHRILIVGHSDSTGGDELNASLSLERANAVRSWLIKRNIDPLRMQTRGAGAAEPVTSNVTATGRQSNRRVEILLLPVEHNMELTFNEQ